jgi:glyoxylase-like metal-dependent hydrolase (beta-lactamase superfamily II)
VIDAVERRALRESFLRDVTDGTARFAAAGLAWDTARLEPIGRWVTPSYSPIRFDTRFFGVLLDAPPEASPDGREVDRTELVSATRALHGWGRGELLLAPPVLSALRVIAGRGRFDGEAMRAAPGANAEPTLRYEVVPALQVMPLRTPTLPPATHTNAFLVGSEDAVLIEPASPYPEDLDRVVAWVEENAAHGVRPRAILATHHHPDHVGGAVALKERLGLPLWAHALTEERLRGVVSIERTLEDGERIELDGPTPVSLRAVHTPGHAPGHLCFVEERSNAMIAGDMVAGIGTILVEPIDGDMALYLESLRRMAALEPSMLLPAHGGPIRDSVGKLDEYVRHRLWREAKVLAALEAHEGGAASPADLVPHAYDDAPPAVWPLAAHAAEAHLIKLERDGRVHREPAGFRLV